MAAQLSTESLAAMIHRQLQKGVTGRSVGLRYMEVLWLVCSEGHSGFEVVTLCYWRTVKSQLTNCTTKQYDTSWDLGEESDPSVL